MNAMAFVSASTLSAQRTASSNVLTQWAASVEGRLEPITMETLPGRCPGRSEEHTSELQSLMRISYAVFCLKKKNTQRHKQPKVNHNTPMKTQLHKTKLYTHAKQISTNTK